MIKQLDDQNWTIRLQAINILVKLSELSESISVNDAP